MIPTQRSPAIGDPWGHGNQGEGFLQRPALLQLAVFVVILGLLQGAKESEDKR